MVLGLPLLPEAYVVYKALHEQANPEVVSMNGALLFFRSYNEAKTAAETYLALLTYDEVEPPKYLWIEPINKLWVDGVA